MLQYHTIKYNNYNEYNIVTILNYNDYNIVTICLCPMWDAGLHCSLPAVGTEHRAGPASRLAGPLACCTGRPGTAPPAGSARAQAQ